MSINHKNHNDSSERDEIDLLIVLTDLLKKKKFIFWLTLGFFFFGILVAIITPNEYKASSIFVPHVGSSKSSSSLGGLASLAGINLNLSNSENQLPPNLYPKIISSLPFRLEMLNTEVTWNGDKVKYQLYLAQRPEPVMTRVKKYTLGLPGTVLSRLKPDSNTKTEKEANLSLTIDQYNAITKLSDVFELVVNEKDGSVYLAANEFDPIIASELARQAKKRLQETIIEYQIQNTRAFYEYTEEQFLNKQNELYTLQDSLADFTQQNQKISSAYLETKLTRLNTKYELVNTVYLELAKQKEQAFLQLKKNTPIFSVIEPVSIPMERSAPKRSLIVIIYTFIGVVLAIFLVLVKQPVRELLMNLRTKAIL